MIRRLVMALLVPLALIAAETTSTAMTGRIVIREGCFFDTGTGKTFHPLGVNYFRIAPIREGKEGHSTFSPGSYDEEFVDRMMETLARDGLNTVRTFLSYHSGANGIVITPESNELSPAYLLNVIRFLRAAQAHGIRVILTWDTWMPESRAWAEMPLPDEPRYGWIPAAGHDFKTNGFRLSPEPIRARANAICALLQSLKTSAPDLVPVVLAWELENEVHFNLDQEPFLSRSTAFAFGGRTFDLGTDSGAQALMDATSISWANACADAIHAVDPEALVSASVFTFQAVGRQGPGTWSKDQTNDMRIPARPLALLESRLDFVDIHIYAGQSESESIAQHIKRDLDSVEISHLAREARRLVKPILIGESGIAARHMRRGPDWQTIPHETGVNLLCEFHQALSPFSFAGVLHWHYGSPDSTAQDEHPALHLFPQYAEAIRTHR